MRLIGSSIHEAGDIRCVFNAEFEDPAFAVGIGVDERWIAFDIWISLDDLAADRGVDVAGGFDGFHDGAWIASIDGAAVGGQFDEDNVGEFFLSVIGNAHGGDVAFKADPFVRRAIAEV